MFGRLPPDVSSPLPGPVAAEWVERLSSAECPSLTARRKRRQERSGLPHDPIVWAEAKGANVRDVDGNVFVDLTSGFGVCAVGHGHPSVVAAVKAQADTLLHALGDVHPSAPKIALMERLASIVEFEARVVLGLNGSDAIAAALKTAVLATGRPGVIAFEGGYHGLMFGPLALCGYKKGFREPFAAQLNRHVRFVPYPSEDSLEHTWAALELALDGSIGAIVVEPALGRGGAVFPPEQFLPGLADRAHKNGALLIVDEIFTGFGRTGAPLASQGVSADVICVGKALGGGLPISACIGRADVMKAWGDPDQEALHTATFAGNPLACAAALACLDVLDSVLDNESLYERARALGGRWRDALRAAVLHHDEVVSVRGKGLLLGVELTSGESTLALIRELLLAGYLTLPAGPGARVLQLAPPLTIDEALLVGFTGTLERVLAP